MLKDKYDKGKMTTTSCEWSIKMEAEWEKWETWIARRVNEN